MGGLECEVREGEKERHRKYYRCRNFEGAKTAENLDVSWVKKGLSLNLLKKADAVTVKYLENIILHVAE